MSEPAAFTQLVACKAVIVRNGRMLLLRESTTDPTRTKAGKYQFTGGRIDPGEPFAIGLQREVHEETGLTVTVGEPFFVGEWFPKLSDKQLHIVGIFFLCEASNDEVKLSDEHDDYQWVDQAGAGTLPIMSPDDQVVHKYFSVYQAGNKE